MPTLAGVEAGAGLSTLSDMIVEVEMETPVGTLTGVEVKELRHWQRHLLTG